MAAHNFQSKRIHLWVVFRHAFLGSLTLIRGSLFTGGVKYWPLFGNGACYGGNFVSLSATRGNTLEELKDVHVLQRTSQQFNEYNMYYRFLSAC